MMANFFLREKYFFSLLLSNFFSVHWISTNVNILCNVEQEVGFVMLTIDPICKVILPRWVGSQRKHNHKITFFSMSLYTFYISCGFRSTSWIFFSLIYYQYIFFSQSFWLLHHIPIMKVYSNWNKYLNRFHQIILIIQFIIKRKNIWII